MRVPIPIPHTLGTNFAVLFPSKAVHRLLVVMRHTNRALLQDEWCLPIVRVRVPADRKVHMKVVLCPSSYRHV